VCDANRHTALRSVAAISLLAAPIGAQDLGPRSFFPGEYHCEYFVDLATLRDDEFWSAFDRSMLLRQLFGMLRRTSGIDIDDIDRIRGAGRWITGNGDDDLRIDNVVVFEGTPELVVPDPDNLEGDVELTATTIAGHDALGQSDRSGRNLWVSPRPGTLVIGAANQISAVLEDRRPGGVPHPELLAFLAGPNVLAHAACGRFGRDVAQWHRQLPVPGDWLDANDSVEFVMARLQQLQDGNISVSAHVRFRLGESGLDTFESKLREALAQAQNHRRLGAFRKFWRSIEVERRDNDLVATVNLGPPRTAGVKFQEIGMLLVPMFLTVGDVHSESVQAMPVPAPAVPPKKAK